jgi:hypothetical protein
MSQKARKTKTSAPNSPTMDCYLCYSSSRLIQHSTKDVEKIGKQESTGHKHFYDLIQGCVLQAPLQAFKTVNLRGYSNHRSQW